ncbi:hypothetical protein HAZT_HAZT010952 [Hyalella azteca]|uniref:Uncharacterized protein n=1 Tax=Hyalella azteca TaxID=294128 RepID=A0A6A0HAQ1_HYAAZ|nr:hypothetical protein HAZT_HAZT010952 [Hyalella azteca]
MATATRAKKGYMVSPSPALTGAKLPSCKEVLAVVHFHHGNGATYKDAFKEVISEFLQFWERARIPTMRPDNILTKLEKIEQGYQLVKKNRHQEFKAQTKRESVFMEELEVFDVAHKDALSIMKIKEDKAFLVAQRQSGRLGYMGSIDVELARKEERSRKRRQVHEERRRQAQHLPTLASVAMGPGDSSSASASARAEESEEEFRVQQEQGAVGTSRGVSPPKRVKNVITSSLAATLDRTNVSDRGAVFLLTEAARAFGHEPEKVNINRSSIRRYRQKHLAVVRLTAKGGLEDE